MKRILLLCLPLLLAAAIARPAAAACDAPENDQFDFWLGTWDVTVKGELVGRNTVRREMAGCTVTEDYRAAGGPYEGRSFNWYDPVSSRWHQVWVDNGGTRLLLSGGLEGGAMVLEGERTLEGKLVTDRITWTPNPDGTVRQHWEQSPDGGLSWGNIFDGLYTKAEP